jgi:hypothetical protein
MNGLRVLQHGNKVINDPVYGNITSIASASAMIRRAANLRYGTSAEGYLVGIELNYPLYYFGAKMKLDMKSVPSMTPRRPSPTSPTRSPKKKTYDQIDQCGR